jgi:hypothetical protein
MQFNSNLNNKNGLYPLVEGAICLLDPLFEHMPEYWNRDRVEHMRKKTMFEKLIIAGALIAAEIDRIQLIERGEEPLDLLDTEEASEAIFFAMWLGNNHYNMISDGLWVMEDDIALTEYTTSDLYRKYKSESK